MTNRPYERPVTRSVAVTVRRADAFISDAHKNGKRTVLMRLKSDDGTKFVAIPIARA